MFTWLAIEDRGFVLLGLKFIDSSCLRGGFGFLCYFDIFVLIYTSLASSIIALVISNLPCKYFVCFDDPGGFMLLGCF